MNLYLTCLVALLISNNVDGQPSAELVSQKLLFIDPPFKNCHASTLVELEDGKIMAAWFGGEYEGHKDVAIWSSIYFHKQWASPQKIASGGGYPCWNPVLVKTKSKKIFLYYKVGNSPREWWGMMKSSGDDGVSWSPESKLPDGFLGPIKNKSVQLNDGSILHPSSTESTSDNSWKIHVEKTDSLSANFSKTLIDCDTFGVIQPSILIYRDGRLQLLCRSRQNAIVQTWSTDNGITWSRLTKLKVPNPNSGIDAVSLRSGLQVLVYNPGVAGPEWFNGRNRLKVAVSADGIKWDDIYYLENKQSGEFSYPSVIETKDGLIHIIYTYDRKNLKHVVLKINTRK